MCIWILVSDCSSIKHTRYLKMIIEVWMAIRAANCINSVQSTYKEEKEEVEILVMMLRKLYTLFACTAMTLTGNDMCDPLLMCSGIWTLAHIYIEDALLHRTHIDFALDMSHVSINTSCTLDAVLHRHDVAINLLATVWQCIITLTCI